jgi:hypothetical protein
MINTQLLDAKIKESGLKYRYLASELGLTEQAFSLKRRGRSPFRKLEKEKLCELVNISSADALYIFDSSD